MRHLIVAGSLLTLFVSAATIASEFHRVIGSDTAEPNRQHTVYADHYVENGDIYLALLTDGARNRYHGYQGFTASLVRLLDDGTVVWRRRYGSEPLDFYRLHRTDQGFFAVVQHRGVNPRHGAAKRVVEVWLLNAEGKRSGTLYETEGNKLLVSSSYQSGTLELIFRNAESQEARGLRLVRIDRTGHVSFDHQTDVQPDTFDVTRDRIYALTDGTLTLLDRDGVTLSSSPVPAWVRSVSANDEGDVYLLSDIRSQDIWDHRRPYHQLRLLFRSGDREQEYQGVHDFDIRAHHLADDGTLWVLGSADDFASLMRFRDGKYQGSITFHSRLEKAAVSAVDTMSDGSLLLLGTTEGRARLLTETNAFAVRAAIGTDFGRRFQRCVAHPDRIQQVTTYLHQQGMIYPRWSISDPRYLASLKSELLASPYYETLPPANALLPFPDHCGHRDKSEYLAFLESLATHIARNPIPDAPQQLMIELQVKDTEILGGATVDGLTRSGVLLSSHVTAAAQTWEILHAEIYPQYAEYQVLRQRLYREAGVVLTYDGGNGPSSLAEAIARHEALTHAWRDLGNPAQQHINDAFPRIRLQIDKNGRASLDRRVSLVEQAFARDDQSADLVGADDRPEVADVFRYLLEQALPAIGQRKRQAEEDWVAGQELDRLPALFVMHEAVKNNWPSTLERALDAGADPDSDACWGKIMLHMAAEENFTAAARVLLDRGANVNQTGPNGETALHIALDERALGVVRLLLDRDNVDLSLRTTENKTALDVARENALPKWVFERLETREAPVGGPFRRADRILAGGSSCRGDGSGMPTMIIGR